MFNWTSFPTIDRRNNRNWLSNSIINLYHPVRLILKFWHRAIEWYTCNNFHRDKFGILPGEWIKIDHRSRWWRYYVIYRRKGAKCIIYTDVIMSSVPLNVARFELNLGHSTRDFSKKHQTMKPWMKPIRLNWIATKFMQRKRRLFCRENRKYLCAVPAPR